MGNRRRGRRSLERRAGESVVTHREVGHEAPVLGWLAEGRLAP